MSFDLYSINDKIINYNLRLTKLFLNKKYIVRQFFFKQVMYLPNNSYTHYLIYKETDFMNNEIIIVHPKYNKHRIIIVLFLNDMITVSILYNSVCND